MKSRSTTALFAAGLFLAASAVQASSSLDPLGGVITSFGDGSQVWLSRVLPLALGIFKSLAALEIIMTLLVFGYLKLSGKLVAGGMLATAVQKTVVLGLFLLCLQSYALFLPRILSTFQTAGELASGVKGITPGVLLTQGIYLMSRLLYVANSAGILDLPTIFIIDVIALMIFVCFVLMAWSLTSILCESYVLLGGGILFIGFAGNRVTIPLAENYIVSLVRLGIQAYLLLFMVAVANQLVPNWGDQLSIDLLLPVTGITALLKVGGQVLIFTLMTVKLPNRLAHELTAPSSFLNLRQALIGNY